MSNNKRTNTENLRADIAIIGGGGAGLTAALAAAEAGAKDIITLEKAAEPGGNARRCAGIFAVESPTQQRLGINTSRDEVFRRLMETSRWLVDPRVVRAFVNKSGELIRWLEAKGMRFEEVKAVIPGGVPYSHVVSKDFQGFPGERLIGTLEAGCRNAGVRTLCKTRARKILTGEGGVTGVLAEAKGRKIKITASSVIITTGGFGGNRRMLQKYFPAHGDVTGNTLPQMTGDGLRLAEEAGAIINDYFAILYIGPNHHEGEGESSLDLLLMRPDIMLVNLKGERYADEALFLNHHNWAGYALNRQPEKRCYGLIDSRIKRDMIRKKESISSFFDDIGRNGAWLDELDEALGQAIARGRAFTADSLEGLAECIGIKPEVLKATVAQYNHYGDDGYDADFLKDARFLLPLRTPPYYAIPGHQNFDTTIGGIRVNQRMEVINQQLEPIGGLYAAGDNAGSWLSQTYDIEFPASAAGFALSSGHIAGESAAEHVLGKPGR